MGSGVSGTYFIGYARSPQVLEQMLQNMFVGRPPGNYDRLLDFTHPVTGGLFFVPSASFLESIALELALDNGADAVAATGGSAPAGSTANRTAWAGRRRDPVAMNNPTPYTVRPTQLQTRERETTEWLQTRERRSRPRLRLGLLARLGRRNATPQAAH